MAPSVIWLYLRISDAKLANPFSQPVTGLYSAGALWLKWINIIATVFLCFWSIKQRSFTSRFHVGKEALSNHMFMNGHGPRYRTFYSASVRPDQHHRETIFAHTTTLFNVLTT